MSERRDNRRDDGDPFIGASFGVDSLDPRTSGVHNMNAAMRSLTEVECSQA